VAFGAAEAGLDRAAAADRALGQAEGRSALGRGTAAAVTALAAGASVWACLLLGVPAVRSGALPGVALAVLVLTPLAAHEVFSALAPAAQQLPRIRGSAARVQAVLRQPDPVREPAAPPPPPPPPAEPPVRGPAARLRPGRARLRRHPRGEPAAGAPRGHRRAGSLGAARRRAARLGRGAAGRPGHRCRRGRRAPLRRA